MTANPDPAQRVQADPGDQPPPSQGTFDDAERLRKWSFRKRTPQQRYDWLVSMLRVAYRRGTHKLNRPDE
jgi:hypothetical protein